MRSKSGIHISVVCVTFLSSWIGTTSEPQSGDQSGPNSYKNTEVPCKDCDLYDLLKHKQSHVGLHNDLKPSPGFYGTGLPQSNTNNQSMPADEAGAGAGIENYKVANECSYPCDCPYTELRCRAGVTVIKDGCDCCYMCARQQGDLCGYKDKCDEVRGLYCDFHHRDGRQEGICRAKEPKPCLIDGHTYKDGEEFKPDCRRLCTCQDGQFSCTTLCPQEERKPSVVHCKDPKLIEISGKCCKEWTCPVQHGDTFPDLPTPSVGGGQCRKETSDWSHCSVTCGMGVSVRVTNDNEDCIPVEQRRLCFVRPCDLSDKHMNAKRCKSTLKSRSQGIVHGDCQSVHMYRLKYCSICKRHKCCVPGRTKTITVEFTCSDGRTQIEPFMYIKNCECHKEKNCPWT